MRGFHADLSAARNDNLTADRSAICQNVVSRHNFRVLSETGNARNNRNRSRCQNYRVSLNPVQILFRDFLSKMKPNIVHPFELRLIKIGNVPQIILTRRCGRGSHLTASAQALRLVVQVDRMSAHGQAVSGFQSGGTRADNRHVLFHFRRGIAVQETMFPARHCI